MWARLVLAGVLFVGASCGSAGPHASKPEGGAGASAGASGGAGGIGGSGEAGAGSAAGADAPGGAGAGGTAPVVDGGDGGPTDAVETVDGADGASVRTSAGCGRALGAADARGKFVANTVHVAGLADVYLPGGAFAVSSGSFDLSNRLYGVRLPVDYDPTQPNAVTFIGGGCGGSAANFALAPSAGFSVDSKHTAIEVALSYVSGCFLDGGPGIGDRDDSPEVPYFRAVLADVEARFCVDTSRVLVAGYATGAWEAELLGCAASDVVRGFAAYGGGLRNHRPACKGPVAALLVTPGSDPNDPLGPVDATDPFFTKNDSPGQLPLRDEVLARNGCVGDAAVPWRPAYPACVQFTGCPAAFPVVSCPISGVGRVIGMQGGINYLPGPMWPFLSALSPP
jgi:poly(3-hydroxybutyrate) depolymerase